jgi:hypothetical protein
LPESHDPWHRNCEHKEDGNVLCHDFHGFAVLRLADLTDFSYSAERTTQEGQTSSSTSAFQVGSWNAYFAGWIPDTNFFYHAEMDIVAGGSTNVDLSNACLGYGGGTAKNSWYVVGGREHLQVAQGTRAAQVYSLLLSPPLLFENASPTNFVVDHGWRMSRSHFRQRCRHSLSSLKRQKRACNYPKSTYNRH